MLEKPYLIFDAGGTTVFPNTELLIQFARKYGITLTNENLYESYYRLINLLDTQDTFPSNPWPNGYTRAVLDVLGFSSPNASRMALDVNNYHQQKSLWTFTYPWAHTVLSKLTEMGYRMSILSNSDGRTRQIFDELNLSQYFEYIFDSKYLKCEKPDRRIFDIVLSQISIHPKNFLYIGDIYKIDILGANHAGIGEIHLNPLRLYRNHPGFHLDNKTFIESWLTSYINYPAQFTSKLFPFSNIGGIKSVTRTDRLFPKEHLSKIVTH